MLRYSSDGSLDSSFGNGGIVTNDIGEFGSGRSVTLQADGKILVAGRALFDHDENFVIIRYNLDGSLDNTFSFDGMVTTDFNGREDRVNSIRIQTDGKILVAGSTVDQNMNEDADFAVARYNADGNILLAGGASNTSDSDFTLVRLDSTGKLDLAFGSAGIILTDFGGNDDAALDVVTQSDGKLLLVGYTFKDFTTLLWQGIYQG